VVGKSGREFSRTSRSRRSRRKLEWAREKATLEADIIVKTEIDKRKKEIDAEAVAEMTRRQARGEADAIFAKMEAQAKGISEMLGKQAEGFAKIVQAAGGKADDAVKMIVSDKLQDLIKLQVEAVKNIKIDKITVWDSGNGKDGTSSTTNFVSSLLKTLPPMNEVFKMAGMELPAYLGEDKKEAAQNLPATSADVKAAAPAPEKKVK
jgi:flotillin